MEKRRIIPFVVMALACCSISKADTVTNLQSGGTVTLSSYLNNPGMGILVGDKLFNNFTFTETIYSGSSTATTTLVPPTAITLQALSGLVGFGLQFDAGWFTAASDSQEYLIGYDVTVTNSPMMIHDIHLDYNGSYTGNGGYSIVTETALDSYNNVLAQVSVQNPPGPLSTNMDLSSLQTTIHINKDIQLIALNHNSTASISYINQQFSQVAIPEPSSMLLVVTGLAGLWALRRRSR